MFLFFQGIIELISDLDYLFNATQNEKITDWVPPRVNDISVHYTDYIHFQTRVGNKSFTSVNEIKYFVAFKAGRVNKDFDTHLISTAKNPQSLYLTGSELLKLQECPKQAYWIEKYVCIHQ